MNLVAPLICAVPFHRALGFQATRVSPGHVLEHSQVLLAHNGSCSRFAACVHIPLQGERTESEPIARSMVVVLIEANSDRRDEEIFNRRNPAFPLLMSQTTYGCRWSIDNRVGMKSL